MTNYTDAFGVERPDLAIGKGYAEVLPAAGKELARLPRGMSRRKKALIGAGAAAGAGAAGAGGYEAYRRRRS